MPKISSMLGKVTGLHALLPLAASLASEADRIAVVARSCQEGHVVHLHAKQWFARTPPDELNGDKMFNPKELWDGKAILTCQHHAAWNEPCTNNSVGRCESCKVHQQAFRC